MKLLIAAAFLAATTSPVVMWCEIMTHTEQGEDGTKDEVLLLETIGGSRQFPTV